MSAPLPPIPSYDELAAFLVQLEPDDRDGIERLRHALHALMSHLGTPVMARMLFDEAAQAIDAALESGALQEALDVTSRKLEEAMALPAPGTPKPAAAPPKPEPAPEPAPSAAPEPAPTKGRRRTPAKGVPVVEAPPVAPVAAVVPDPSADADVRPARKILPDDEPFPEDADRDLLADFITESHDGLGAAEAALLELESNPEHHEAINTVFRAFHTIKGTSGFLGLTRASEFAHHAESLLSRVREREIRYTSRIADISLKASDLLKAILDGCELGLRTGRIPIPPGYAELMAEVMHLVEMPAAELDGLSGPSLVGSSPKGDDDEAAPAAGEPRPAAPRPVADDHPADGKGGGEAKREGVDASVRVRTENLDLLIDMVGELVIAQSLIAGDPVVNSGKHHDLMRKVVHAGKIVRELQDLSMSMRMVPLKATFQKMTRLVRDVSLKMGKAIEFVTKGEDTEIDRNMVDVIGDPLVHMLRNALDHGVEMPEDRIAAGKPRQGVVTLSATHAGGNVVVTLSDDGKGLPRDKILQKAIDKGIVSKDAQLTDQEIYQLIFAPGLSTAEKVTDLSGRGVGMDVVRRHIESLRGRVEIDSVPGKGTTFTMRLPLTLAITDGMLIRVGEERYIVPTHHIHMSFKPEPNQISTVTGRGEVVLLRGELMPIVRLHKLYEVPNAKTDITDALLMIVGDDDRRSALLVDDLLGQQQVVVKSLGTGLGKVQGVSGGAILGDGRVGLILDVKEILALYRGDDVHVAA